MFEAAEIAAETLLKAVGISVKKRGSARVSVPLLLAEVERRLHKENKQQLTYISAFSSLFQREMQALREVGPKALAEIARYMVGARSCIGPCDTSALQPINRRRAGGDPIANSFIGSFTVVLRPAIFRTLDSTIS